VVTRNVLFRRRTLYSKTPLGVVRLAVFTEAKSNYDEPVPEQRGRGPRLAGRIAVANGRTTTDLGSLRP
jgi:hypothetical protein